MVAQVKAEQVQDIRRKLAESLVGLRKFREGSVQQHQRCKHCQSCRPWSAFAFTLSTSPASQALPHTAQSQGKVSKGYYKKAVQGIQGQQVPALPLCKAAAAAKYPPHRQRMHHHHRQSVIPHPAQVKSGAYAHHHNAAQPHPAFSGMGSAPVQKLGHGYKQQHKDAEPYPVVS